MEPEYAAQEIINGIAMGQTRVILPQRTFWLPFVIEILPWCIRDYFVKKLFGLENGGIRDNRNNYRLE